MREKERDRERRGVQMHYQDGEKENDRGTRASIEKYCMNN